MRLTEIPLVVDYLNRIPGLNFNKIESLGIGLLFSFQICSYLYMPFFCENGLVVLITLKKSNFKELVYG
jgi:hypothetical protein